MSLKLEFLKSTGRFDEDFQRCGLEDTEFGFRLMKNGMHLLYNPEAVGYHCKHLTFADVRHRLRLARKSREVFARKPVGIELARSGAGQEHSRWYRAQLLFVHRLMPFFMPLTFILDSQIPLPGKVYRAFYECERYLAMKSER